jgi:hypothetical protein
MSTHFRDIRAAIKALIQTQATKVAITYDYEASTFTKFPAVVVAPSENQADYGDTQKDKDTFVFKLRAYFMVKDENDHPRAERALEAVVDQLMTIFRQRDALGASCDWLQPTPSVWQYEIRGEAIYRMAEITLRATKYIN